MIHVYTDGSYRSNIGAWAFAVRFASERGLEYVISRSGTVENTTSQRMELTALMKALDEIANDQHIMVFTDSAYLMNCFEHKWYAKWRRNSWMTEKGAKVKNRDIWEPLINRVEIQRIAGSLRFTKVKGHSGDRLNELVDKLALETRERHV